MCYWHELAREQIVAGPTSRAGLLATNSVRGGPNRRTLGRIRDSGQIFMAWSDEPWIVEGAAVRVAIVAQDDGSETQRVLDGRAVPAINSDLTSELDLTLARALPENSGTSFRGDTKGGAFDIDGDLAREMLRQPTNVNGRPNADVVVPWVNGRDVTARSRGMFIIDFGTELSEVEAAAYESPFAHVEENVQPARATNRRSAYRERWWRHIEPRPGMRNALAPLSRFIVTTMVAKHRTFVWLSAPTLPDQQVIVVGREDDYAFGVLHSRAHELWSLRMGTWLGVGNDPRYTPTSTFETFPFPWPLDTPDEALTDEQRAHRDAIAEAARALDETRRRWLNPPELVREEPDVAPSLPPRLLPVDEDAERELRKRTLTNLYNARPAWLAHLHTALDAAVFAAYGWAEAGAPEGLEEEELLSRLLALNLERGGVDCGAWRTTPRLNYPTGGPTPSTTRRATTSTRRAASVSTRVSSGNQSGGTALALAHLSLIIIAGLGDLRIETSLTAGVGPRTWASVLACLVGRRPRLLDPPAHVATGSGRRVARALVRRQRARPEG